MNGFTVLGFHSTSTNTLAKHTQARPRADCCTPRACLPAHTPLRLRPDHVRTVARLEHGVFYNKTA